jgi:hypothetical protein
MRVNSFFLSLLTSSEARKPSPAHYKTVDGYSVSYAEGQAALRSGRALLVGELLIGWYCREEERPLAKGTMAQERTQKTSSCLPQ